MDREADLVFHKLVDLSPEEREAYFRHHLLPSEVRREVELLLAFDSRPDGLIASVASVTEEWVREREPDHCGAFHLIEEIGKGGMGSVFLAIRDDGEVKQRAAVKFLHAAAGSPLFRERFLRERQILATLDHPGIARLLDAGHTPEGRPYLAMDFVDGVPIDLYAERLDLREKLILFLRVCDAVSYAHSKLIVHRDLKPSNILVDRSGQPKLLDFGIAKILDATTDETLTQERLLTPQYASPEQIRGIPQSTATDIYSLGAILYKLLTGKPTHSSPNGTREELLIAVCAAEPPAPSTIVALPRDLDFIVAKALRKEPEDRYISVGAFGNDIRALLESRPVAARSGNTWYRTRKFLRRYWIPVTAAAIVILSLGGGLYVANRERAVAQRRFTQVRRLANRVLALDPSIRALAGSTKARQEILTISQEYLAALQDDVRGDPDLAIENAEAYLKVAQAQGVPVTANLGRYSEADANLVKAEALLEPVLKASPHNRAALLASADVAHDRMILASTQRRREDTIAQATKAVTRLEAFIGTGKPSEAEMLRATLIGTNAALAFKNQHLYDQSIRTAQRALEIANSSQQRDTLDANILSIMADSMRYAGDLDGALHAIREARSALDRVVFTSFLAQASAQFNVRWREGAILGQPDSVSLERPDEAAPLFQRAFDLVEQWAAKDPDEASSPDLAAQAARELGKILAVRDPKRALAVEDRALELLNKFETPEARRNRARLLSLSSYPLRSLHRNDEAKARIERAFDLLRQTKDYPADHVNPERELDVALRARGDFLADTGQVEPAIKVYEELLNKTDQEDARTDLRSAPKLSLTYRTLAALDRRLGRESEAASLDAKRVELWQLWRTKIPNNSYVLHQLASSQR